MLKSLQLLRASVTCLLGMEQVVEELFGVVKGVGDVHAGRGAGVLKSLQLLRASVTCLLGVEQVVEELFAVVKGVGDVLAGRGAGY